MNKFIKTTGAALCLAGVKSSNIHELTFHERLKIAPNKTLANVRFEGKSRHKLSTFYLVKTHTMGSYVVIVWFRVIPHFLL